MLVLCLMFVLLLVGIFIRCQLESIYLLNTVKKDKLQQDNYLKEFYSTKETKNYIIIPIAYVADQMLL